MMQTGSEETAVAVEDAALAADIAALEAEPPEGPDPRAGLTSFAVRPIYDRILIRQFDAKDIVRGRFVVPEGAKEKPARGLVLAVGEGRIMRTPEGFTLCPLLIQPGNVVLFGRYGGTDVDLDDEGREQGKILREDEVLAVIDEVDSGVVFPHEGPIMAEVPALAEDVPPGVPEPYAVPASEPTEPQAE